MRIVDRMRDRTWSLHLGREPVLLVWLIAIAIAMFFVVSILSRAYTSHSQAKASEWHSQGIAELRAGNTSKAVNDFRVALSYWRDNFEYQVTLANSLATLNQPAEAKVYLTTLWQREPENGTVNLELARLYAKAGDISNAIRFYHNAIYALWSSDPETQRRSARIELTEFLLDRKLQGQAESELIALSGNLPADATLHEHVGDLFMRVPDYQHAFAEYRQGLRFQPHRASLVADAGHAAFELWKYSLAAHYLQLAVDLNPKDNVSADMLATAKLIQRRDPNTVPPSKRGPVILDNFRDAGSRLTRCIAQLAPTNSSPQAELHDLSSRWTTMNTHLTVHRLRANPDLADSALDLVFSIEITTNELCGRPSGSDLALLRIAQEHEGDE